MLDNNMRTNYGITGILCVVHPAAQLGGYVANLDGDPIDRTSLNECLSMIPDVATLEYSRSRIIGEDLTEIGQENMTLLTSALDIRIGEIESGLAVPEIDGIIEYTKSGSSSSL